MYKDKILNLLRSSQTGFLSGEELALKLGISRTMVWKHIKSLEQDGFVIEAVPSRGYRITAVPDILRPADIGKGLKTKTMGREIVLLQETASTNTVAMEIAGKGAAEGTVVLAEQQSGGKGRLGRSWVSPKGNLYLSVVLRPALATYRAPLITLMGAVAVVHAIRACCRLNAAIKWPNDVYLSGRKLCGLLTEMSAEPDRIKHIVLGIGLNVNMAAARLPADIRHQATTLAAEAGHMINRTHLLQFLLREIEQWYRIFLENPAAVLDEWTARNMTIGNQVTVSGLDGNVEGLAEGVDREGRLMVRSADGLLHTVAAGDVTIVKKN